MNRRWLVLAAVCALCPLSLAACGDDDEDKTVTQTRTVTAQAPTATLDETAERTTTTPQQDEPRFVGCTTAPPDGAGTFDVKAAGVECATAQEVAAQYQADCVQRRDEACNAAGFSCDYKQTGDEVGTVSCMNAEGRVRFQIGS